MAGMWLWLALAAQASLLGTNDRSGTSAQMQVGAEGLAYDYTHHGQDWIQGSCASRQRQSPIDFPADGAAVPKGKFSYSYQVVASGFEFANTGHALVADFAGMGYGGITYENGWYNLLNIAVHSTSEHTFGGQHYPLELHLVHKKYDSDALLVVAVQFDAEEAAAPPAAFLGSSNATMAPGGNPQLQFFAASQPAINTKTVVAASDLNALDLNQVVGDQLYYEYAGSLTSPPCAEVVTWFVGRAPLMASAGQVQALKASLEQTTAGFGNWRSVMPLNGRTVIVRTAVHEEPPPHAEAPTIPLGPNPRTDREFRATKWAKDALKVATSATQYVQDLDQRLRRAALAHARALAPDLTDLVPTTPPQMPAEPEAEKTDEVDVAATAAAMARSISAAASGAIDDAKATIATEAKLAAEAAAQETANMIADLPSVQHTINTKFPEGEGGNHTSAATSTTTSAPSEAGPPPEARKEELEKVLEAEGVPKADAEAIAAGEITGAKPDAAPEAEPTPAAGDAAPAAATSTAAPVAATTVAPSAATAAPTTPAPALLFGAATTPPTDIFAAATTLAPSAPTVTPTTPAPAALFGVPTAAPAYAAPVFGAPPVYR